jgi:hypothetical protein
LKLTSIALFGDESGSHSTDSYVSIGIVISTQPPSLHFRATVLRPRTQREYLSHRYRSETAVDPSEKLYNKHYCNLIRYCRRDLNIGSSIRLIVLLDAKDKARTDNFEPYLRKEVPSIADLQFVDSKAHPLVQLADLLNGCLRADFLGDPGSEAKLEKVRHLREVLGVEKCHHLKPNAKFRFEMF